MRRFEHVWAVCLCGLLVAACGKGSGGTSGAADEPYVPVEGESAEKYLALANDVAPTDPEALKKALALVDEDAEGANLLDDGGSVAQTDTATISLLKSAAGAKETLDPTSFSNPDGDTFAPPVKEVEASLNLLAYDPKTPTIDDPMKYDPKKDTVTLASDIMVSRVTQIPVKNQGPRGTCAAHTGVSYIEYALLKKYGSKLSTIDLSEQRFYMMSKSELWSTGGVTNQDAGSAWVRGYRMSMGTDGVTVPSDEPEFNIPLESDCPYNPELGANELQIPQSASCKKGAVKVTNVTETFWMQTGNQQSYHSNALQTAQQIVDYMKTYDLPVPVAADITENWSWNDGMITLAKDKSPQMLGGHAFLVVGARKLDNSKYPGEGGMCFVIKNSWGTGWGTNGYSCMTLAWFNAFRRTGWNSFFDLALDVTMKEDYVLGKKANSVPDGLKPDAPVAEDTPEGTPTPVPVDDPADPSVDQIVEADDGAPAAETEPEKTADGFTVTGLVGSSGAVTKALYKIEGGMLTLKGILKGETDTTQPISLALNGSNQLIYADPDRGDKVAGVLQSGKITLCAGAYADVCVLNYVAADKRLVIGLTEQEFHKEEADPNANFTSLISFAGYGIDSALAGLDRMDFRLVLGGLPTNALRLKVDAISGTIQYKGKEIGNYQKLALCSGDFKNVCRFVVNSEDRSLNIFFKAKK